MAEAADQDPPFIPEDDDIIDYQQQINEAIAAEQPLIAQACDFSELRGAFSSNPRFLSKIPDLEAKYSAMRSVRGDGNCFYRSYIFGCLEKAVSDPSILATLKKNIGESKDRLVALGFSDYIIEDFWETTMELIFWVESDKPSADTLRSKLCDDPSLSQYVISYARMMASFHLQANEDQFAPFIPDGRSVADFVRLDVEPVDREADQIQCVALINEFGVPARIEQMIQADEGPLTHVDLGNGAPEVFLLFRPGHYDLLYSK